MRAGDILVGKVTPKGETQLTPEEKLLRAIFGEKAGDVKDTSLRIPHGIEGIVIDVKVLSRRGIDKDERSRLIEDIEISNILKDQEDQVRIILDSTREKVQDLLFGKQAPKEIKDGKGKVAVKKGETFTREKINAINLDKLQEIDFEDEDLEARIAKIVDSKENQIELIKLYYEDKINKIKKGDELPPGVLKTIKVYVAMKRKIAVGDKISGRHGNKGIVSVILPEEDMPFTEDGTAVDVVLNPLGVPSRMNAGQILETHLGWASKELGKAIGKLVETNNASLIRNRDQGDLRGRGDAGVPGQADRRRADRACEPGQGRRAHIGPRLRRRKRRGDQRRLQDGGAARHAGRSPSTTAGRETHSTTR